MDRQTRCATGTPASFKTSLRAVVYVRSTSQQEGSLKIHKTMFSLFPERLSLSALLMLSIAQGYLQRPRQAARALRLFSLTSPVVSSSESMGEPYSMVLSIPRPETCEEIGALLSAFSEPPDVLFLDGDLGAGKTTFSRGFVSCKLGIDDSETNLIRITSPTYLLSHTYEYKSGDSIKE
eukprot:scaffold1993_cov107-Cylindrotheca_fusiformis.AAC.6